MRVAIIDADFIGRKKHRFPNLASMKLSGYHKTAGDDVILKTDYLDLDRFDKVYISKVFTDTPVDPEVLALSNVEIGGTGFYFDKAPALPCEIEHSRPDYHLYDDFVEDQIAQGVKRSEFKEYQDYSIGFITRGCFRKCGFCVNQKYDRVFEASPLREFIDPDRPKICLLDDNFLGFPKWRERLEELRDTGKPFKFKQGLDERLLTPEKCKILFSSNYDGEVTFAFDRIEDYDIIEGKLNMIRETTTKQIKFYVLVGYDPTGKYDSDFWRRDIADMFKRIELLGRYGALPYLMRFNKYEDSPLRGLYIVCASWINQPSFYKKHSLKDFCKKRSDRERYYKEFEELYPDLAYRYGERIYWGGVSM
jgi:hypothetical protein